MNRTPAQRPFRRSPLRRWLRAALWAGLLISLAMTMAEAAETVALYEAEVPVAGQDPQARSQAQRAALGEVLVRVSGNRGAASHPALAPMLEEAARYVQQYRYLEVLLPGEPERRAAAQRGRDGIPIPDGVWAELVETAAEQPLSALSG